MKGGKGWVSMKCNNMEINDIKKIEILNFDRDKLPWNLIIELNIYYLYRLAKLTAKHPLEFSQKYLKSVATFQKFH